jgi:hypothetical protein
MIDVLNKEVAFDKLYKECKVEAQIKTINVDVIMGEVCSHAVIVEFLIGHRYHVFNCFILTCPCQRKVYQLVVLVCMPASIVVPAINHGIV